MSCNSACEPRLIPVERAGMVGVGMLWGDRLLYGDTGERGSMLELKLSLHCVARSSSRRPPTSKKETLRGVPSVVVREIPWSGASKESSLRSASLLLRFGNSQVLMCSGSFANGAGVYLGAPSRARPESPRSWRSVCSPRLRTKSSSLPQCRMVGLRREGATEPSIDSPVIEPYLNLAFFTPRSRTKEPRTSAFAAAVAKSNSTDASKDRVC